MSYYPARSLMNGSSITAATTGLVGELNVRYPARDHSSDGWIGDASHSARASDHNPDYSDGGIVRAVDVDNNGALNQVTDLVRDMLGAAIGDPRSYYVIYAGKIASRTYGWVWRAYYGSNPHDHHVHLSILAGPLENDTRSWGLGDPPRKVQAKKVSVSRVRRAFKDAADGHDVAFSNGVGRIQQVLNRQHGEHLVVDGIAGRATLRAWRRFERTLPEGRRQGQLRIPDRPSLGALGRGRFRLVR